MNDSAGTDDAPDGRSTRPIAGCDHGFQEES